MALVNKTDLKNKFLNGKRPVQEDFADLIDSCYGFTHFEANLVENKIQYSTIDSANGTEIAGTIDLSELNQTLNYDPNKNKITISGSQSETAPIGYWSESPSGRNSPPTISTDSRVGINTSTPDQDANLHVKGTIKLLYGPIAIGISNSLATAPNMDRTLTTIKAVRNYYDHQIDELKRVISILDNSVARTFVDVKLEPNHVHPLEQEHLKFGIVNAALPNYFLDLEDLGGYGNMFVVPMEGKYQISTILMPTGSGGESSNYSIHLEYKGEIIDEVLRVTQGSVASASYEIQLDAEKLAPIRLKVVRETPTTQVKFHSSFPCTFKITKPIPGK